MLRVIALALSASVVVSATSQAALFAFDDVPEAIYALRGSDEPQTYAYQCDGKSFCSYSDIYWLTNGGNGNYRPLTTTRDGITATFTRGNGPFDVWPPGPLDRSLSSGNDTNIFNLFLADFSEDLTHFQTEMIAPTSSDIWIVLELWSGPNATGSVINSATFQPGDFTGGTWNPFAIDAGYGQTFRSAQFGWVLAEHPDCRVGCFGPWSGPVADAAVDNIVVTPEPSITLLITLPLSAIAWCSRVRGRSATTS